MTSQPWTISPIEPFGIVVTTTEPGMDVMSIGTAQIAEWINAYRIAVLRGFAAPEGTRLTDFGKSLGEVLEWDFGSVNDLKVKPDAKNYLYTPAAVPFHWDGAFVGRIPHYIVFHCAEAPDPDAGGETLFTDAVRLVDEAEPAKQALWAKTSITYSTEKVVHYGGSFTSPMLARHPVTGETVMRYAEPVEDLNPVHLDIHGIDPGDRAAFIDDLHARLNDPRLCLAHQWQVGDIVIADNHALLHGRRAFQKSTARHIRRVNVL
jgi:alpha-ketoglutarate-dependent taurine dioxygenase